MNPEASAAQSIFETVKASVEIDGSATIPLARLQRQIQRQTGKEVGPTTLFEQLQKSIEFPAYGTTYVAVILDEKSKPLSPGRIRKLEREKGEVRYKPNSKVIVSRRPNNNWGSNENFTGASLKAAEVTIFPRQRWIEIENERAQIKSIEETEERKAREEELGKRFVKKSERKRLTNEYMKKSMEEKAKTPDWMYLAKNKDEIATIPDNAVLTVGFGVDKTVPLRALSYPLLALSLLREMPNTALDYYAATQFSELFGLSQEAAEQSEDTLNKTLQAFINTFYPNLSNRIQYIPSQPLTDEQNAFIEKSLVPILQKKQQLQEFAIQRNGVDSLRYMAAHSLYMRDPLPIDPSLFINPLPADNRPVVMVGGDAEQIMWDARKFIAETLGGKEPIQLFTTLGRTPPYFRKENEPNIGNELTRKFLLECSPEIYRDYASLLVAISKSYGDVTIRFDDISAGPKQRSNFLEQDSIGIAQILLNNFSLQMKEAL